VEGIKVNRYSEIIKEFSLFSLLFVLASTVAVSQDTSGGFTETIAIFGNDSVGTGSEGGTAFSGSTNGEPSEGITIVETPSSDDVGDANTDTDTDDANTAGSTNSEGNKANGNSNSGITPRNFNTDKLTSEEWNAAELLEWILSTVNSEDMTLPPLPPVKDTIDFTTAGDIP
jgi:hypothetical protein